MSRTEFLRSVNRIKEYIRAGDCIQTVFSQRFNLGTLTNSFGFYRVLRSLNPSPYMFFFKYRDLELAGSSPELLVRKKGSHAELRPIAGTRPRGGSPPQDLNYEIQLRASVKERAEHLMLVDLARNDLGRVCDYRTISVKQFERVERYSHVMHLVSDVEGKIKQGHDACDLLKSVFPAGTLSGAPKVRAMEIIDELEKSERGPYGGSLGYMSYNGDMDMCITIRTLITYKGKASVQAGAGIVFDSNPGKEYQECLNKAKALFQAFKTAGKP
jgi:anthranilate synthase component 1